MYTENIYAGVTAMYRKHVIYVMCAVDKAELLS